MGPDSNTIEWVTDQDDAASPLASSSSWAIRIVAGVCLIAVLGLGLFTLASYDPVAAPPALPTPVPTPALNIDLLEDTDVQGRFTTELGRLPELTVVLPRNESAPIRFETGSTATVDLESTAALYSFETDASGRWIAGLSGSVADGSAELWVAEAGSDFLPIAANVSGFSWHASEPEQIAYLTSQGVVTLDVANPVREPETVFAATGDLELWGTWGFVIRPERNDDGFHVLDPQGNEIATGYRGAVIGALNQRLIVNLAGGRQSPVFVFADTGQAWPMFALTDTQIARQVAAGGFGNAVAIHVSDFEADVHEIRIFLGAGGPPEIIATTESAGSLRWSDNGGVLYYLDRDDKGGVALMQFDLGTRRLRANALADDGPFSLWSAVIALMPQ